MPPTPLPDAGAPLGDAQAMRLALDQAARARLAGEVPVGAVLVRDGKVVAVGANAPVALHDPSAHAEVVALRSAAAALGNYRLDGCTLYVTLEPCAMCAGAILHARLARVVFGAADPRAGAAGSVVDLFADGRLNHHTEVRGGLLAPECAALLQGFFRERRDHQARTAQPLREDALRTPAAAFADPALRAWEGAYRNDLAGLDGLRLHHVERGSGPLVFVCLHGPAGWGVRFAPMADYLAGQGVRVLVPDLVGFGRSDKPKREDFHRLDWHVAVLRDWCQAAADGPMVLVADAADPGLAFALAEALEADARGVVLLPPGVPGASPDDAAHRAPHPDRGHAAAVRAFAGGWGGGAFAPGEVLRLQSDTPQEWHRAVEYFRG